MRIAFVLDMFGGGGKERRCLQLIQGLNDAGWKDIQVIIVNNRIEYPELFETSAQIHIVDRKNKNLTHFQTLKSLRKLLKGFNPDIVMVWGLMSAFYTNIIRLTYKFKYIGAYVADCDKPKGMNALINKTCCCLADKMVGNSLAGLKTYCVPEKKQVCIYNGYNKKRLRSFLPSEKDDKKKELGIDTPFVISMAATFYPAKDYDTFIKVAHKLRQTRSDVTFLALGKGPLLEHYKQLCNDEYNQCVKFLGFRSDLDEILEITTVSCLFSNTKVHGEGVSNSILESFAHGVPAIATNDGGSPEIITDGANGFLVPDNDVEHAASCIQKLLDDKDLRHLFSAAAKATQESKFNLESKTNEYIKMFRSLE